MDSVLTRIDEKRSLFSFCWWQKHRKMDLQQKVRLLVLSAGLDHADGMD